MSSSEQQPTDETKARAAEGPQEPMEQNEFQPLYEFVPEQPLPSANSQAAPLTKVLPEEEVQPLQSSPPSQEATPPSWVYPPPPSYYQNMPVQAERPPVPAAQPARPLQQGPVPPYATPGMPHAQPPYGQIYGQLPVKKSYRWVWILVSVLGVIILTSCGLCGWGAYSLFSSTYQQVSSSLNVVDDFYSNLQSENYSAAYSDLVPRGQIVGLTEAQFTKQASTLDNQDGPVTSFVLNQPAFSTNDTTGTSLTRFTIAVDIKRKSLSYTAFLTVTKIGNTWKITEYDRL